MEDEETILSDAASGVVSVLHVKNVPIYLLPKVFEEAMKLVRVHGSVRPEHAGYKRHVGGFGGHIHGLSRRCVPTPTAADIITQVTRGSSVMRLATYDACWLQQGHCFDGP